MTCATPAPLPVMPASIFASATAQSIGASIPRTGAGSLRGPSITLRRKSRDVAWDDQTYPNPPPQPHRAQINRSEEHTSELQSLMRISYAVFCLKKKKNKNYQ